MANTAYDVAVIGGGIHGCSTAYHLASRGARVVLLEAETTRRLLPAVSAHVTGAIWVERAGFALPFKSVTAFRRAAETAGAHIRENNRVSRVEQRGARWHLDTATGPVSIEYPVMAAGAWTGSRPRSG